jgi:hypothetical protein
MSRTCTLACIDCKEALWIGQAVRPGSPDWRLYGDEEQLLKLQAFLNAHQEHWLQFGDSEEFLEFEDVDEDKDDTLNN